MVCGIASIVFCFVFYIGIPCGIVGLVLGIVANRKEKSGMALAGIITGAIGTALSIFILVVPVSYTHLDVYKRQAQGGAPVDGEI